MQPHPQPHQKPHQQLYPGFWLRLFTRVLDVIIFGIPIQAVLIPITKISFYAMYVYPDNTVALDIVQGITHTPTYNTSGVIGYILVALTYGSYICLEAVCLKYYGTTPGRKLVGTYVVDKNTGNYLSLKQCALRQLGSSISLFTFGLAYIVICFDAKKQCWHDKLANAIVVSQ